MAKLPRSIPQAFPTAIRLRKTTLTFAEQLFPARPSKLWRKTKSVALAQFDAANKRLGYPAASNATYVNWLKRESMLRSANQLSNKYVGSGSMWQHPYAKPRPRSAVHQASVWYTAYANSLITKPGTSIIATLADEGLWQAFQEIGITAIHTGPLKLAGGMAGWRTTPSIDGQFDRISNKLDPLFGTKAEFRRMTEMAQRHDGIVIDDVVPGHTGKGADFRLAEMKYRDYPGIYHMVEIAPDDLAILPDVPRGQDAVNIDLATEEELKKRGYIIGKLQRVIFFEPGVKETNWSATRAVKGVDGVSRRWVYLHYFKAGQPSINWLDPTFAGMKLVIGDALHSLDELGTRGLRLDANGFLGIEKSLDDAPAWSEGHPMSEAANMILSGMVRKLGGFTFQELNLSFDAIKTMAGIGADLSYDFINRPSYHHALAVSDTEFLRLTLRAAHEFGIDPASLVHAMQNHDDLTYELVHFWTQHKDDDYDFRDTTLKGSQLRDLIRKEMNDKVIGKAAPYNLPFTTNGIACTSVSFITAVLGYKDIHDLQPDQIETIKQAHLLMAMFNAWQPGVFALSGWDLLGSLTLDPSQVKDLVSDGDTRWINRGAYDLMDINPEAKTSAAGMPRPTDLYGSLPDQLEYPESFVRQLQALLKLREDYGLATAHQIDIPEVSQCAMLVMVHRLPKDDQLQVTVLNFSNEAIAGTVSSEHLPATARVTDMMTDAEIATVDNLHSFHVVLQPYQGLSLLITEA